jgi:drug/metabolite transporter (DMT)-like permease
LGEKMNPYKWAGIALIILGVAFIGYGSGLVG